MAVQANIENLIEVAKHLSQQQIATLIFFAQHIEELEEIIIPNITDAELTKCSMILSESSLKKIWFTTEEDEAWKHLQKEI